MQKHFEIRIKLRLLHNIISMLEKAVLLAIKMVFKNSYCYNIIILMSQIILQVKERKNPYYIF